MKHLDDVLDLILAFLIAFVVFVWRHGGSGAGEWLGTVLLAAYVTCRWHSTRSWQKELKRARDNVDGKP